MGKGEIVTSNFSFSHSVFKRLVSQGRQKVSLCGNGLNIFFSQTAGPNRAKLGSLNVPWAVLFKNCSQNFIPSKTLVAVATKWGIF